MNNIHAWIASTQACYLQKNNKGWWISQIEWPEGKITATGEGNGSDIAEERCWANLIEALTLRAKHNGKG